MELYLLNRSLEIVQIIDVYKSLIWKNSYNKVGECELYLPANELGRIQMGYYLKRSDDEMACRIRRMELDCDVDNGENFIINGYDVKDFLDQRIIVGTEIAQDISAITYIQNILTDHVINPTDTKRKFQKPDDSDLLTLGTLSVTGSTMTEQASWKSVGEKIREICNVQGWGYKFTLSGGQFVIDIYEGEDKTHDVIFSPTFDNLATSKSSSDNSKINNYSYIGGAGEGSERIVEELGTTRGINRYETFTDAKDIPTTWKYSELTAAYPNGAPYQISEAAFAYRVDDIAIPVYSDNQLDWLLANYSEGTFRDGYYYIDDDPDGRRLIIAALKSLSPDPNDEVTLYELVYMPYLMNKGVEQLAESGQKLGFEGTIIPEENFKYKSDYNLGDVVRVHNEYGIFKNLRLTDVTEVFDENGYTINPNFGDLTNEVT